MSADLSDPGNMVLTMLWLVAGIGWAAWRLVAHLSRRRAGPGQAADEPPRPGDWYAGPIELALLVLVTMTWVSAGAAAHYKHPARLIAWEWVGLFVTFFLVRQLAVRPAEQHGLFAAFLAGAVALSAHAAYQAAVELPSLRQHYGRDLEGLRQALREDNVLLNEEQLEVLRRRIEFPYVFGVYANPNSFA